MLGKAVIRPTMLLFCAALAAGVLTSGVTSAQEQGGQLAMVEQPAFSAPVIENGQDIRVNGVFPGFGGDGVLIGDEFASRSITQGIVVHEPRLPAGNTESTAVPLPPAAWTGLSGLLGLGMIGFARNLRRYLR